MVDKMFNEFKQFLNDNPKLTKFFKVLYFITLVIFWFIDLFNQKIPDNYNSVLDFIKNNSKIFYGVMIGLYIGYEFLNKKHEKIESKNTKKLVQEKLEIEQKYQSLLSEILKSESYIKKSSSDILKLLFERYKLDSSCRITLFHNKVASRAPEFFYIMERYSTGESKHILSQKMNTQLQ